MLRQPELCPGVVELRRGVGLEALRTQLCLMNDPHGSDGASLPDTKHRACSWESRHTLGDLAEVT